MVYQDMLDDFQQMRGALKSISLYYDNMESIIVDSISMTSSMSEGSRTLLLLDKSVIVSVLTQ